MERFSRWRDASTGLAPFVYPVPPAGQSSPLLYVLLPFGALLGVVRITLLAALFAIHVVLVQGLCFIFLIIPVVHRALTGVFNSVFARLELGVLGFIWIPVEKSASRRGRASLGSAPLLPSDTEPLAGDLLVCNWSSYIEILYLTFRYNPIFLLPVSTTSNPPKLAGFVPSYFLSALGQCGHPPPPSSRTALSLVECADEAKRLGRVAVLFPECTTSNNRALLRLANLSSTNFASGKAKSSTRVFLFFFKHEAPSPLLPSATLPIPSSLLSLSSVFRQLLPPFPRTLSVRTHTNAEATRLTREDVDTWGDRLSGLGKVRRIGGIGWEEKGGFLEYVGKRKG